MAEANPRIVRKAPVSIEAELQAFARDHYAKQPRPSCVPFPDPVGEDRDERRVIEWDFTR